MDPWADVRLRARACHAEALAAAGGDRSAAAIVAAAADLRGIEVVPFVPGTRFGHGILGVYERVGLLVSVDATLPPGKRELVIAHEIGHHELHDDEAVEVTAVDGAPGAAARVVGYSHRERREVAADHFASEFLLPTDWLRGEIVGCGRRPSDVAADLGLPPHVVMKQAIRAVCLPPLRAPAPRSAHAHPLDPAQAEAATWSAGPLLVDAGPGTGKTATLVARVAHLLASGVTPSKILVMTFSTRAAAELRGRVAESAPDAAATLWIGTLHAFGLEILHAWHHRIGRGPRPRVLDRDGALDLLERHLGALPLSRFRDLRNPAAGLGPVLRAIERCKDECVTPADYAAATQAAALDGEGEAVAAAAEVAAIYAAYQGLLDAEDSLDLGDLVAVAARLLAEHDDVALHYSARFAHVLVDEVQDLNVASTRLLQSLCGPGTTFWAVGDVRQAIYRFRGAAPAAVADFTKTFGGATLALDHSYRATPEVVNAFTSFSDAMPGGAGSWTAQRPSGAPVRLLTAPTPAGEVAALRDRVETLRAAGVGYGDQTVLGRTHRTLERVAAGLERHGVPVAYLGDLFTRDEVRDLLCLVSLDAEPGGLGLLRVATQPPYDVPRGEIVAVVRWIGARKATVMRALRTAKGIRGVSPASARALVRLAGDVIGAGPSSTAWTAMTAWLFEAHDATVLAEDAPARRTAVYQLIRLAAEEGTGRAAFLARVRRIAALGAGRDHGAIAPEAQSDDAVRLMTIHAAKGLEFAAVHLPMASSRHLPLSRRRDDCPPPPDLGRLAMTPADHDAEERSLWFVALSRARDSLTISHARRYDAGRDARPSPFLSRSGVGITEHGDDTGLAEPTPPLAPQPPRPAYPAGELDAFVRCPQRYRYDVIDGLADATPRSGRRRMLTAVLAALGRIEAGADEGETPSYADGAEALAAAWATVGPADHPHEAVLRRAADRLAERLVEQVAGEAGATRHRGARWTVPVGAGAVEVAPHRVVEQDWGAVTVQVLGSHRHDLAGGSARIATLSGGARAAFPDARVTVEVVDVDTGDVAPAEMIDEEVGLERYRDAIAEIERGRFAPRPDPRACPTCPYYLICGA